jgi:phosphate/sulfate permease
MGSHAIVSGILGIGLLAGPVLAGMSVLNQWLPEWFVVPIALVTLLAGGRLIGDALLLKISTSSFRGDSSAD